MNDERLDILTFLSQKQTYKKPAEENGHHVQILFRNRTKWYPRPNSLS
ncbi:hypothetical protein HMPREF1870_01951 [Bacteroidales bacterium KA00344]|nr:hypothetical protein HMPREF1870_01951 [Bacteroidales bacterium KA00344]